MFGCCNSRPARPALRLLFKLAVLVLIFSAGGVSGFLYGLWIDGTGLLVIGAYLAAFLAILLLMLWRINQQTAR